MKGWPLFMKSAMRIYICREIKISFSRFMAIFAISLLGSGLFAGLKVTAPVMRNTADHYFDEQNLADVHIISSTGFTKEDIRAVMGVQYVENVMATYSADAIAETRSGLKAVRVHAYHDGLTPERHMNRPVLIEGRLPVRSGECLIDKGKGDIDLGEIGSSIIISDQNSNSTIGLFNSKRFTVTGIVNSPVYISIYRGVTNIGDGSIAGFILIPGEDIGSGIYTDLYVRIKGAKELLCYSDEYLDLINDAKDRIRTIAEERDNAHVWYITDRYTNQGFAGFGADAKRIDAVTTIFPLFFFLVAALVCLTTMTRMVEEQRTQIGILKALGYSKLSVAAKYLIYTCLACIFGCFVGIALGFAIFPSVIFKAYCIMYTLPPAILSFNMKFALTSSLIAILCISAATLAACYNELVCVPAELIRPKAPVPGRKVLLERAACIWNRMTFLHQVAVRNLFRYKRRLLVTVLGVCGCTALLLTGFGLRDSIIGIVSHQFGTIHSYDMIVSLTEEADPYINSATDRVLASYTDETLNVMQTSVSIAAQNKKMTAYLIVPENSSRLREFVALQERETSEAIPFPEQGKSILSEKLALLLDVHKGDEITIERNDAIKCGITVGGITENYFEHYIYMSREDYIKLFKEEPACMQILCKLPKAGQMTKKDEQLLANDIMKTGYANSVFFTALSRREFGNTVKSLDFVVILIIICASLLAFVVLYNLTNINITERIREIATFKVLGFFDKEISAYIFRENAVLTAVGIIMGLVAGVYLHQHVVVTSEVDMVMFERSIKIHSYLFSIVLTFLFAALVHLLMHIRLRNISMVESLKSTE